MKKIIFISVVVALFSCEQTEIVTPSSPARNATCDSCLQIQELLISPSNWVVLDTVFNYTHADSVTSLYYGWFDCTIDTMTYSPDSTVRNRMWCQN